MAKIATIPFPLCAKVLPTVYDNTLSYYEQVCKLTKCCQEIVDELTDWSETIAELQEAIVDIAELKRQVSVLDTELVSLNTKVNENYNELKQIVSNLDKFVNDSVKDMNDRVNTVESSLSSLSQTIYNVNKHLEKEIADLREELIELVNSKYVNFEEELAMLQLKVNQMKVNLQGQIDEINARLNEIDTTVINPWHWELGKISQQKNVDLMYRDLADSVPLAKEYCTANLTASEYSNLGMTALDYVLWGHKKLHLDWVFSPTFGWRQELNNVLTSIVDWLADTMSANVYAEMGLDADGYSALNLTAQDYYKFSQESIGLYVRDGVLRSEQYTLVEEDGVLKVFGGTATETSGVLNVT